MKIITDNTKKVLSYVSKFQRDNGYSPSIPEIMGATGIKSRRGVSLQLDKLQGLGIIHRDKQARRAIKILSTSHDLYNHQPETIRLPVVGDIRAGLPNLAEQHIEEYRDVPLNEVGGRDDAFLLRVRGDSMNRAGFEEGDIVIVVPNPSPNNGDIVVAFIKEEETATLKRFKKLDNYVVLLPDSDNPRYKPIIERQVIIQGKVLGKLSDQ